MDIYRYNIQPTPELTETLNIENLVLFEWDKTKGVVNTKIRKISK